MLGGQELGSYKLISRIGAGGMGEVWKAEDPRLRRTVAIKILPADSAASTESNARFLREARTAAQLYHPNIATIHSIEEHDQRLFIVMEYVEGESLAHAIRAGRLDERDVGRIGRRVAEALAEAHAHGIVHRDIKPDNVILSGDRVKVLDFGIAKKVQNETDAADQGATFTDFRTQRGVILGTIQYMSPEQAMGKPLDSRSDLFSLGVVLYEVSTGRLPFRGETVTDTLTRIIRDEAPDLRVSHPNISPALADIVMRCLVKDRDGRFQKATEVAQALAAIENASTARAMTTGSDLPTAVSASREPTVSGPVVETDSRPAASGSAPRGPWPWIFATVLLVALSVAATAWYLTRVLRPSEPATLAGPGAAETAVTSMTGVAAEPHPSEAVPTVNGDVEKEPTETAPSTVRHPPAELTGGPRLPPEPAADAPDRAKAEAWARRAFWFIGHGQEAEGVEALKRAVALDPAMARGWLTVGVVALRRGRNEAASRAFSAALRDSAALGGRDVEFAKFGSAIAEGDLARMSESCRSAPLDREFAELRRMARDSGASCSIPATTAPPGRGPGPPGGVPPRPKP